MRRSKGMGKWTSVTAWLQPARLLKQPFRVASARCISALKEEFISASSIFAGPNLEFTGTQAVYQTGAPSTVRQQDLLVGPRLPTNAQGHPRVRLEIELWRECLDLAWFLKIIKQEFDQHPDLANGLLDGYFTNIIKSNHDVFGCASFLEEVVDEFGVYGLCYPWPVFCFKMAFSQTV
jgi:6-phosphogluconate dehydrogenase